MTIGSVMINVRDFEQQKAFWGAVLGSEIAQEIPQQYVWFQPQDSGGVMVALQAVADPTEGPRRLHLDAMVPDIAAARERIIELGGSHLDDREMGGFHWTVMADPEGNEFCIATSH